MVACSLQEGLLWRKWWRIGPQCGVSKICQHVQNIPKKLHCQSRDMMMMYQRSCGQGLNERAPTTRGEVEETHIHTSTKQNITPPSHPISFPHLPQKELIDFCWNERAGALWDECVRNVWRPLLVENPCRCLIYRWLESFISDGVHTSDTEHLSL